MGEKAKDQNGKKGVTLILSGVGFLKRMLFNRFLIVRDRGYRVVHFGYATPGVGNAVLDYFVCAIHGSTLERQKEENMRYLGRLGPLPDKEPEHWTPPATFTPVSVSNHFGLTRIDSEAEITFYSFSLRSALEAGKAENAQIPTEPVAILRSDVEIHQHLVKGLHDE